jgi:hypothetical protein
MLAVLALGCAATLRSGQAIPAPDLDAGASLESVAAQVDEDTKDVKLRFEWPTPLSGRCATVARRIELRGTQTIRTAHSVRAQPDGDQLRVETFDVEVPADAPATVLPLAETWHAEWLVDAQGRLLRAQSLDPLLDAAARAVVTTRLAQRWQSLVGAWAGRTLPIDVTYTATAPEQTSGGPVRLQITVRVDGRVPCEPGTKVARCVRLRIVSQPTSNDTVAVAKLAARELLPADEFLLYEPARVRGFSAMTTIVLVTEPDTLVPHRFTERRMFELRIDPLVGTDGVDVNRQDVVTTACRWRDGG